MTPSRQHDETLVAALRLARMGLSVRAIALKLGKNSANLWLSLRNVRDADQVYCGHEEDVLPHYPKGRQK